MTTDNLRDVCLRTRVERPVETVVCLFLNRILFLQILELTAASLIITLAHILVKCPGNLKPIELPTGSVP